MWVGVRYPRVRKFTAEKMYVALVIAESAFEPESLAQVQTILTETLWDGDVAVARIERNKLCDLLGVAKPKTKIPAKKVVDKVEDDLDSYRDLVDRMQGGY